MLEQGFDVRSATGRHDDTETYPGLTGQRGKGALDASYKPFRGTPRVHLGGERDEFVATKAGKSVGYPLMP